MFEIFKVVMHLCQAVSSCYIAKAVDVFNIATHDFGFCHQAAHGWQKAYKDSASVSIFS